MWWHIQQDDPEWNISWRFVQCCLWAGFNLNLALTKFVAFHSKLSANSGSLYVTGGWNCFDYTSNTNKQTDIAIQASANCSKFLWLGLKLPPIPLKSICRSVELAMVSLVSKLMNRIGKVFSYIMLLKVVWQYSVNLLFAIFSLVYLHNI